MTDPQPVQYDSERIPVTHDLKVWVEFYDALADGAKPFEARRDDRAFAVGDTLLLREWDRHSLAYTGRKMEATITYKLSGPAWGIESGYCVLGIARVRADGAVFPSQAITLKESQWDELALAVRDEAWGNDIDKSQVHHTPIGIGLQKARMIAAAVVAEYQRMCQDVPGSANGAVEITDAMIRAASGTRARDDEGELPSLADLIDCAENTTRTIIRAALVAALAAFLAARTEGKT